MQHHAAYLRGVKFIKSMKETETTKLLSSPKGWSLAAFIAATCAAVFATVSGILVNDMPRTGILITGSLLLSSSVIHTVYSPNGRLVPIVIGWAAVLALAAALVLHGHTDGTLTAAPVVFLMLGAADIWESLKDPYDSSRLRMAALVCVTFSPGWMISTAQLPTEVGLILPVAAAVFFVKVAFDDMFDDMKGGAER